MHPYVAHVCGSTGLLCLLLYRLLTPYPCGQGPAGYAHWEGIKTHFLTKVREGLDSHQKLGERVA